MTLVILKSEKDRFVDFSHVFIFKSMIQNNNTTHPVSFLHDFWRNDQTTTTVRYTSKT